jgi:hypothetical protein
LASSLRWAYDVAGVTGKPAKVTLFKQETFLESASAISLVWENLFVHSRIIYDVKNPSVCAKSRGGQFHFSTDRENQIVFANSLFAGLWWVFVVHTRSLCRYVCGL